ncbi:MAG TPA: hypothetical protein VMU69_24910, partial [Bradyrhizobium sp.]|nr:hypothetical protein [Bradyrhizobium sp.]
RCGLERSVIAGRVSERRYFPSFRGDAKHRTRNLEIPGLVLSHHPGMTAKTQFLSPAAPIAPELCMDQVPLDRGRRESRVPDAPAASCAV